MTLCTLPGNPDRRRLFWATQSSCNTTLDACGQECGVPGLKLVATCDTGCGQDCAHPERSIANDNYIAGIALNILLTDAAVETDDPNCGFRPGNRGGHWSQSFAPAGYAIGSRLRTMKTTGTINEQVARARDFAQADLSKMIKLGLVKSVDVTAAYVGGNAMTITVMLHGESDTPALIGVAGSRLKNSWIWAAQNAA